MFENLIESKPKKQRTRRTDHRVAWCSTGCIIFGAVKATQGAAEASRTGCSRHHHGVPEAARAAAAAAQPPPPDVIVGANPPPKGFQTVVAADGHPEGHPAGQPERSPSTRRTSPARASRAASRPASSAAPGPVTSGEVFLEAQVDDPVQPISQPAAALSAGAAERRASPGRWTLQFVVDTTGHAETGVVQGAQDARTRRSRSRPGKRS